LSLGFLAKQAAIFISFETSFRENMLQLAVIINKVSYIFLLLNNKFH